MDTNRLSTVSYWAIVKCPQITAAILLEPAPMQHLICRLLLRFVKASTGKGHDLMAAIRKKSKDGADGNRRATRRVNETGQ